MKRAYEIRDRLEMGRSVVVEWRWTVSRGRDTYGYDICTCTADGVPVGRCNGGGYDMHGASLAEFLNDAFPDEVKRLARGNARRNRPLYAVRGRGGINGACGLDCVVDCMKAMGLSVKRMVGTNGTMFVIRKGR